MKNPTLCTVLILILTVTAGFSGEFRNIDKPAKGCWDIKMKKAWSFKGAGEDVFTVIDALEVDDDGNLFVMDRKNVRVYVFDKNGRYISSFGRRGQGPGEFSTLRGLFLLDDHAIVVDDNFIHYFLKKRESPVVPENNDSSHFKPRTSSIVEYEKSIPNNYVEISPARFVDLNRFLSVKEFIGMEDPGRKKGTIALHDLVEKNKKILFTYDMFEKGSITIKQGDNTSVYSFSIASLTPKMILYYKNNRVYFGKSDEYRINVIDLKGNGNEKTLFSLERAKVRVSDSFKENATVNLTFPPEIKKMAKDNLPNFLNYFWGIYVDEKGFIYIFEPTYKKENLMRIDIFSNTGKYLYSSAIEVENHLVLKGFHISGTNAYLVIEDENGDVQVAKYYIELPGKLE